MKKAAMGAMAAVMLAGSVYSGMSVPLMVQASSSIVEYDAPTVGTLEIHKKNASKIGADGEYEGLEGVKFTAYKFMSLTPGAEAGEFASFDIVEAYKTALKGITPDTLGNYSAADLEAVIDKLLEASKDDTGEVVGTTDEDGLAKSGELDLGYYLVVETLTDAAPEGTIIGSPFIVAIPSTNNYNNERESGTEWIFDLIVEPKNPTLVSDKNITNANGAHENGVEDGVKDNVDTVAIGDNVNYLIEAQIPNYEQAYFDAENKPVFIIKDTKSKGLAFYDEDGTLISPLKVTVGGVELVEDTDYTIVTMEDKLSDSEPDLVIEFTQDFLEKYKKEDGGLTGIVKVEYTARLTDDAVIGMAGNTNKMVVEYTNSPGSETNAERPEVITKAFTFQMDIQKISGDQLVLANAEFELYKADEDGEMTGTAIATEKTDEDGKISFEFLDAGIYYIKEIKAPAGYTLLSNPIKIEIVAKKDNAGDYTGEVSQFQVNEKDITAETVQDASGNFQSYMNATGGSVTVTIENKKGFTLPETGGMGVTIFLAIGLAGIMGVSVMMMKKRKEQ